MHTNPSRCVSTKMNTDSPPNVELCLRVSSHRTPTLPAFFIPFGCTPTSISSVAAGLPASRTPTTTPFSSPERRIRRKPYLSRKSGKSETITPSFLWATDRRATVHTLRHLLDRGINEIHGKVQCKRCKARSVVSYDLLAKFREVAGLIAVTRHQMHDRAPAEWMNPRLADCVACGEANCVRPVAEKKREINWLFMLLGQTVGCCSLGQLKYFCKNNNQHRTGAKDRLLYLTYLCLCKQLLPTGPFQY